MGSLTCPWGCGWRGSAEEYSKHYNECPARVCPKCGSFNIFFYRKDALECLKCGNKWSRKEVPVEEKTEKHEPKIFKTEEEFRVWLERQGLTAEPGSNGGLFKDDKRVGSYFETSEGVQVVLAEDAKTWLIRDKVFVEVEVADEEAMAEGSKPPTPFCIKHVIISTSTSSSHAIF